MSREAVLARIDELRSMPGVRFAASHHRFIGHSTDQDLRETLEVMELLLEPSTEQPS
jgi:hypothetical protein